MLIYLLESSYKGNLTSDPGAIEESRRILPTGYWKGSGLALALDLRQP